MAIATLDGREGLELELIMTSHFQGPARLRYGYHLVSRDHGPVVEAVPSAIHEVDPSQPFRHRMEIGPLSDGFYHARVTAAALDGSGQSDAGEDSVYFAVARGSVWGVSDLGEWYTGCVPR